LLAGKEGLGVLTLARAAATHSPTTTCATRARRDRRRQALTNARLVTLKQREDHLKRSSQGRELSTANDASS